MHTSTELITFLQPNLTTRIYQLREWGIGPSRRSCRQMLQRVRLVQALLIAPAARTALLPARARALRILLPCLLMGWESGLEPRRCRRPCWDISWRAPRMVTSLVVLVTIWLTFRQVE